MERGTFKSIRGRVCATALVIGLLAASAIGPGLAPAQQRAPNPYRVYVACGLTGSAKPAHSCAKGAKKAAFFRSKSADVFYKLCVRFPTGRRLCATHQFAAAGALRKVRIFSDKPGSHKVTWYVKGKLVGTRHLRVRRN
jgi:hypothetical protein